MLTCLEHAGVLRRETQPDPERGGSISIAHLHIHEHSFIAVTVPMADRLAAPRDGGHLLRDLGLIIVLLEFCVRQGPEATWTPWRGHLAIAVAADGRACEAEEPCARR